MLLTGLRFSWTQAIKQAESLVHPSGSSFLLRTTTDLSDQLTQSIKQMVTNRTVMLDTVAKYYFNQPGKHIRPLIVLLMAHTITRTPSTHPLINKSISKTETILDFPTLVTMQSQRLAEITEMIHTASLLHDDVIDESSTRRNIPSVNAQFGNKKAVLGGDYLLAKASVALARLRNLEVLELLAQVIANLVEGEFLQLRTNASLEDYLRKSYLKTASLIAKSCKATAILEGASVIQQKAAYDYGKNVGIAFQIVDDLLDFTQTSSSLGKPANADLKLGICTAPVIYAAQEFPELDALIKRRFREDGDVEQALEYVRKSRALENTKELAKEHSRRAVESLEAFEKSSYTNALEQLAIHIIERNK